LSDTLEWTKSSKILFLLDGLDEVSQDLGDESAMFRFLKTLLDQPNVIITSRPSGKLPPGLKAIDMELETIGFHPDQVNEYLERVLPEQTEGIQSFLRDHPLVQDLVRIPIQLDAFGFTWNESLTKLDTMTAVYQAIEDGLWKKDVLRLEKRHDGKLLTEGLVQDSDPSEIKDLVKDEACFLEGFAFTGLHNDVIDFESTHQRVISTHFSPTITLPAKILPHLSFLRTSNLSPKRGNQSYHFLHLTYQEYFAARYFVRQWQAGEPLKCLALGNEKPEELGTSDFLRKHKYTARYDIFWRFVAGLFDAEGKGEEFCTAIEDAPRDLLGPTHQRLVMHCLSETSMETPLRRRLENRLKEWLLFECEGVNYPLLASEVEFPERALVDALQEARFEANMNILASLKKRPTLPSSIVNIIISWLKDGLSEFSKISVLEIFVLVWEERGVPDDLLAAVVELVLHNNEGWSVRKAACDVLREQLSIPIEHLTAVAGLLKDEDSAVRSAALDVLFFHSSVSDEHLSTVVLELALCKGEDRDLRELALETLSEHHSISDECLTAMVELALCKDEDSSIRSAALGALSEHHSISDKCLTAMVELALCKDEDSTIRSAALGALSEHHSISEEYLTAVVELALCKNENSSIRSAALWVLSEHHTIYEECPTVAVELALCTNEDRRVGQTAFNIFQRQPSIFDEGRTAMVALLESKEAYIREAALRLLKAQPRISDAHLTTVVALLDDRDSAVKLEALNVLQAQPSISDEHLTVVVVLLDDQESSVRREALKVLQAQPSISDEHLTVVVALLDHWDSSVREEALEVFQALPSISDKHLTVVVALLDDQESSVRREALKILQAQPSISDEHLMVVVGLLETWFADVKMAASGILQARPLSDEHLKALSLLLDSKEGGDQAETVLRGYKEFYCTLLNGPAAGTLLKLHFSHSFAEQWSWYVEDGALCVNAPDGIRNFIIDDMEGFVDMVRQSRPPGFPSTAGGVCVSCGGGVVVGEGGL
jgi:hypothetical protein